MGGDFWPPHENARGCGWIAAPGRAQHDVDAFSIAAPLHRQIIEFLPERGPSGETIFARERQLHIAQARIGGASGHHRTEAVSRHSIASAQRLQPALGFFLEHFERGIGSERTAHGRPSFRVA